MIVNAMVPSSVPIRKDCFVYILHLYIIEAIVAQTDKRATVSVTVVVRFPLREIKYLIFSCFRSVNEGVESAKHGFELHHSIRNDLRYRRKIENGSVLMGNRRSKR